MEQETIRKAGSEGAGAGTENEGVRKKEEIDRFTCPRCGANTVFDPEAQPLPCPYCGNRISAAGQEGDILSALDGIH